MVNPAPLNISGLPNLSGVPLNEKNMMLALCASALGTSDINNPIVKKMTRLDYDLAHARTEVRGVSDPVTAFNAAYNDLDAISKLNLSRENKLALGAQAQQLKNLTADRDSISKQLQEFEHEVEDLIHQEGLQSGNQEIQDLQSQNMTIRDLFKKSEKVSPQQRDEIYQDIQKRMQDLKAKTEAVRKKIKDFSEQQVAPYQQQIQQLRTQVNIQAKAVATGIKLDTKPT